MLLITSLPRAVVLRNRAGAVAVVALLVAGGLTFVGLSLAEEPVRRADPASWGGDHVGKSFPEYVTGDECLFCHRDIGARWSDNRHQSSLRLATERDAAKERLNLLPNGKELAAQVEHLLGSRRSTRFLRRSPEYGKLEMLTTSFVPADQAAAGKLDRVDAPRWDGKTFADRCAGCHCTAVDAKSRAFAATSLDCFVCHGNVDLAHTKDARRVLLSKSNREPREVVSLCGQCHLRGGKSNSTGLPYANTFVAGDNLFRDFQLDLSDAGIAALPEEDRHVYLSARAVVVEGAAQASCLACHQVHVGGSDKHRLLPKQAICSSCHSQEGDGTSLRDAWAPANRFKSHHRVCDF